jgi:anti-sigma regulatory factor (Ser/Thr protein kinase)
MTSMTKSALRLPAEPENVRVGRQWLATLLGEDHPALYNAQLMLSEGLTNAIIHTESLWVQVSCRAEPGLVTISIRDEGGTASTPELNNPGGAAEHGRGLEIIDACAKEWGWRRLPAGGVELWFTLGYEGSERD